MPDPADIDRVGQQEVDLAARESSSAVGLAAGEDAAL